jgi:DNA gyrase/topoisomerase IV subunit A
METDHAELSIDEDFHKLIDFIAKVVVENKALEKLSRLKCSKQNYAIFETNMKKEDIVYMLRQCLSYVRSNCFVQLQENRISFPKSVIMRFVKNIDEFNPIIQKKYKESIEKYIQNEKICSNKEEFSFCESDTDSENEEENTPQKYLLKLDLEIQKIQEQARFSLERKRTAEEITKTIQKEKEQVKKECETLKEKNSNLEKEVKNLKEEIETLKKVETLKEVVNTHKRKAETEISEPPKRQRTPEEQRLIGQLMACLGSTSSRISHRFEKIRSELLFGVVNRINVCNEEDFSVSDTEGIEDILYYLKKFAVDFSNAGYIQAWFNISRNRYDDIKQLREINRRLQQQQRNSTQPVQGTPINSFSCKLLNQGRDVAVPLGKN